MSLSLRILLFVGALLTFIFIVRKIRRKKILMQDALFWVLLSVLLVIAGAFPGLLIVLSQALGFISPSNFVFLIIVAVLLIKIFSNSLEISMLRHKVEELAQEIALRDTTRGCAPGAYTPVTTTPSTSAHAEQAGEKNERS
ncbi:MAG: DUF2304 domain-containing protein [Atopobiaceae bacterium]|jgi:hypothetical protein